MPLALLVCTMVLSQGRVVPAGAMSVPRTQHTATLLGDGRVMVAGGRSQDATVALSTTELFDPKSGAWKPGPPMNAARAGHTATALLDGRVLVIGGSAPAAAEDGSNRFEALASAELYDPKKNVWTRAQDLATPRNGHTSTRLLDGSVLVIGGARPTHQHLSSVERFDPVTGAFSERRPMAQGRWLHEAAVLGDGSVLVLGGRSNQLDAGAPIPKPGVAISSVERFDTATGVWHRVPELTEPRQRTAVVSFGRRVAVFGGQTGTGSTNYVEWWEAGAEGWTQAPTHLTVPVAGHSATLLPTGDVLLAGGEPPSAVDTSRVQRWAHQTQGWCLAGQLKSSRKSHSATLLLDGSVLFAGGTSGGITEATAERWVPQKGACVEP
jgi:hypothetical protein